MSVSPITAPQSVDRILAVIELLAADSARGASLSELCRGTQAPKSSLISLLSGMVASGHLSKDEGGVYRLGARMFSLAMRIASSLDMAALARPLLEGLVEQTGETVLLGTLAPAGDVAMYIDKVESLSSLRYTVSLGERRDLYSSAIGKLLLAYMSTARQDAYLQQHDLHPFTPATITTGAELRKQLDEIRQQGYAITAGERIVGADAIAAPVFGPGNAVLAALVVAGPSERMRAQRAAQIEHVLAAAAHLSERMSASERVRAAA